MVQNNLTALVQIEIGRLIDSGKTDLQEIYTIVCDKFGIPRTSVRRIKKQLVEDLKKKVKVLDSLTIKKHVKKPQASNPDNLTLLEQRILELLATKKSPIKFRSIFEILNFNTHYPKITKRNLSNYLSRLAAAKLVKHKGETSYIIVKEKRTNV